MSHTERRIAPGFTIGKSNRCFGWSLAVAVALAGILAAASPDRLTAQAVGTPAGGTTTGGTTTGGTLPMGAMPGGTIITLDAFAQMLLAQIQAMLAQEFGPVPPEVMDFLTDLILREFFLGTEMAPPAQLPAAGTSAPGTGTLPSGR